MTENEKSGYKIMDSSLGVMFFDKDGNKKIVMENKYYTPEIEEFHVGFEYEAFHNKEWFFEEGGNQWVKSKVSLGTDILTLNYAINCDFVRVKYLDREDIESLGLEYDNNAEPIPARDYPHMLIPTAYAKEDWMLYHYEYDSVIWIENYKEDSFYFKGVIKNKSELKKLLKQLGI